MLNNYPLDELHDSLKNEKHLFRKYIRSEWLTDFLNVYKDMNLKQNIILPIIGAKMSILRYENGSIKDENFTNFNNKIKLLIQKTDEIRKFSTEDITINIPRHPKLSLCILRTLLEAKSVSDEDIKMIIYCLFDVKRLPGKSKHCKKWKEDYNSILKKYKIKLDSDNMNNGLSTYTACQ